MVEKGIFRLTMWLGILLALLEDDLDKSAFWMLMG